MAGKYAEISLNDWLADVIGPYLEGRTHGCSCCSETERVTEESLLDHIKSLEIEIEECKLMLDKFFKKEN